VDAIVMGLSQAAASPGQPFDLGCFGMTLWQGSKAELVTAIAATLGIPFYLGVIHLPAPQLVLYGGVASAAMATGEFAEYSHLARGGLPVFLMDASIWFGVIALFGGIAYLLALVF
jgi:hypothetical protein